MFNKESIKNLSGVKIITTNPLMQTISGRVEIAKEMMSLPRDMWADYAMILEGEPLENLTKDVVDQKHLVQLENEQMAQGVAVPALATDNHAQHIKGHAIPLNDPSVRLNGQVNQIYLDHIMEHYTLSKQTAPDLMYMVQTGMMPVAAPPPPGGAPQAGPMPQVEATQGAPEIGGDVADPAQDLLNR